MRIKLFLWYLRRVVGGIVFTKYNLAKFNSQDNKQCCFCHKDKDEIIKHLIFGGHFARDVCFVIQRLHAYRNPHGVPNMFGT